MVRFNRYQRIAIMTGLVSVAIAWAIKPVSASINCDDPSRLTPKQMQLCLDWAGYLDRFENGEFDLQPLQAPSSVQTSTDALAAYNALKLQEGRAAIESGDYSSGAAQYFGSSDFHNRQTARRLSGEGPLPMPSSVGATSIDGIDMIATAGPVGNYKAGGLINALYVGVFFVVVAFPISMVTGSKINFHKFLALGFIVAIVIALMSLNNTGDLPLTHGGQHGIHSNISE